MYLSARKDLQKVNKSKNPHALKLEMKKRSSNASIIVNISLKWERHEERRTSVCIVIAL